jgi:tetratricopeptide (TPR) repeat protein
LADLDAAITASEQAVAVTPTDDPDRARYLSRLGNALQNRFRRTGTLTDLDAAITASEQAVAATPTDHPDRARHLSNLGAALHIRYERTGARADLDAAITASEQAVAVSSTDDPDRALYLSNHGLGVQDRYERTGTLADLDAAITFGEQAVAATPTDHLDRARRLSNLGAALHIRSERTGTRADLDAMVEVIEQAVAATPTDHPNRAIYLSNLGAALRTRYERTGTLADLDAAVKVIEQAVAATPTDHPNRAIYLSNLGAALRTRYERTGTLADLDAAIRVGRDAVAVGIASPRVRANVARWWGHTAAAGQRWPEAVEGFAAAIGMLERLVPRSLTRADQEHLLAELGGLGSDAAACCLQAGWTGRAVELFEQGRGILLGQALDNRADLTALTRQHPELARRFTVLADELDRADDGSRFMDTGPDGADAEDATRRALQRRRETASAFDRVIGEIRSQPGFDNFLHPPSLEQLAAAATDGTLVLVNVSWFGSHALILTDATAAPALPMIVPLPDLSPDTVGQQVVDFLTTLDTADHGKGLGQRVAAEAALKETLGWLWDQIAGPVLDQLGIYGPPTAGKPWPRLWWCTSGLLSFLPLHAAGHHRTRFDAVPMTVIDRVVSSYIPTIRALVHARRPPAGDRDVSNGPGRVRTWRQVLAVAMPRTRGAPDLPGARAEAESLRRRFADRVTVLSGPAATHDSVLGKLPAASWAHFACHGLSDLNDPSASHLILHDGLLTVVDVTRLRLEDADLAFLSACSTARPGERLADEAIQLATAFQLAGYRHVIGTLWPIDDQHAVDLAGDVYAALCDTGGPAGAVHTATRQLRNHLAPRPSVWASYIHVGC